VVIQYSKFCQYAYNVYVMVCGCMCIILYLVFHVAYNIEDLIISYTREVVLNNRWRC
jgi:hypothetical protein